jgi:hypothetical protein
MVDGRSRSGGNPAPSAIGRQRSQLILLPPLMPWFINGLRYVRYRTIVHIMALSWRRSYSCAHPVCLSAASTIESDVYLTTSLMRRLAKLKRFSRISWPRFTRSWNA